MCPVLYAPTPPCPFCPDFGLTDPFWPQRVPFLDAPTPLGLKFVPFLDASTPSCPFCPFFGHTDPFMPSCVPLLDAWTPSGLEFGHTDPFLPVLPLFGHADPFTISCVHLLDAWTFLAPNHSFFGCADTFWLHIVFFLHMLTLSGLNCLI